MKTIQVIKIVNKPVGGWMTLGATIVMAVAGSSAAFAQGAYRPGDFDPIQARITGGSSDRGKCTIDVVVDGAAEIEIRGTEGRMRTTSGSRSTWRRLECNQPFPQNPNNFKFSPQEGRGRQSLLRSPSDNRGTAVVRIEDPNGGSEGYKFDLEWSGSNAPVGGGGRGPNGNGSIFDGPGNNNNGPGNTFPGNNNGPRGGNNGPNNWNETVNFSGTGDGYYRNFRGGDDMLRNATVNIDRSGSVRIELSSTGRNRYVLQGRLVSNNSNRLVANVSGGGVQGNMEIQLDRRNRVEQMTMSGSGRDRFDLRWNAK